MPIVADLTDESDIELAFEKVASMTDELFAIIHFAGVYMLDSLVEMPKESFGLDLYHVVLLYDCNNHA